MDHCPFTHHIPLTSSNILFLNSRSSLRDWQRFSKSTRISVSASNWRFATAWLSSAYTGSHQKKYQHVDISELHSHFFFALFLNIKPCSTHLSQQAADISQLRSQSSVLAQSCRKSCFTLVQLAFQSTGPGQRCSKITVLLLGTGTRGQKKEEETF